MKFLSQQETKFAVELQREITLPAKYRSSLTRENIDVD